MNLQKLGSDFWVIKFKAILYCVYKNALNAFYEQHTMAVVTGF